VPFNFVEALLTYESKLGLGVFGGWPTYPQLPDGTYDIDIGEITKLVEDTQADIDEIAELVRNLQAGDQDADQ